MNQQEEQQQQNALAINSMYLMPLQCANRQSLTEIYKTRVHNETKQCMTGKTLYGAHVYDK